MTYRFAVSLLAALFLGPACAETSIDPPHVATLEEEVHRVCDGGPTVHGIDVSHHQGRINWGRVDTSQVGYVFAKASESTTFRDPRFVENMRGAESRGILRGAYHFFRATRDGRAQAEHFLNTVERAGGPEALELPLVIDVEDLDGVSHATARRRLRDMADALIEATGEAPIIYTSGFFWEDHHLGDSFSDMPLWTANYRTTCPRVPDAWDAWTFWQYTQTGRVSGVSGNVDRNHFNGSLDDLLAFANGAVIASAPCVVPDGRDGLCMHTARCGNAMESVSGHCDGSAAIQCCVPEVPSHPCDTPAGDGTCEWTHQCGDDAESIAGFCPGHDLVRCCVPDEPLPTHVCGDGVCTSGEVCDADCAGAPAAWTCPASYYDANDGCDCRCGAFDPDCDDPTQELYGCSVGQFCDGTGQCATPGDGTLPRGMCQVTAAGGARGFDGPSFDTAIALFGEGEALTLALAGSTDGFYAVYTHDDRAAWVWGNSVSCNAARAWLDVTAPGTCVVTAPEGARALVEASHGAAYGVIPQWIQVPLHESFRHGGFYRVDLSDADVPSAYVSEASVICAP